MTVLNRSLMFAIVAALGTTAARADDAFLGEWHAYARAAITPDFHWAVQSVSAPHVIDRASQLELAPVVTLRVIDRDHAFTLHMARAPIADLPRAQTGGLQSSLLSSGRNSLVRDVVAPSFSANTGSGVVSAGIVVAEQRFASMGFGSALLRSAQDADLALPNEKAVGTGVRLAYTTPISNSLSVDAFVQSRVNMEALQAYRGVFSDPGDFDIPSQAGVTLRYQVSPRVQLAVSADRVRYSELTAFSSQALPTRFLSLLGDSSSPEFAWEDLDVLGAEVSFAVNAKTHVRARYGTHQQPEPSSGLLRTALDDALGGGYVALGFERQMFRAGRFAVSASYAETQSFLGNVSATNKDATGEQLELEASWRFDF